MQSYYLNFVNKSHPIESINLHNNIYDNQYINYNYLGSDIVIKSNNIIGEGHFGKVFCANFGKSKQLIAIKTIKNFSFSIFNEISLLNILRGIEGIQSLIQVPKLKTKKYIIQKLCGPSLEKSHYFCGNKFSEFTIINIVISIIQTLKDIHKNGILHRNLKPANICYGL